MGNCFILNTLDVHMPHALDIYISSSSRQTFQNTLSENTAVSAASQKINLVIVNLEVSELMSEVWKEQRSNSKCLFNSKGIIQMHLNWFLISPSASARCNLFNLLGCFNKFTDPASNSVVQGIKKESCCLAGLLRSFCLHLSNNHVHINYNQVLSYETPAVFEAVFWDLGILW